MQEPSCDFSFPGRRTWSLISRVASYSRPLLGNTPACRKTSSSSGCRPELSYGQKMYENVMSARQNHHWSTCPKKSPTLVVRMMAMKGQFQHQPVLVASVLHYLNVKSDGLYVDCTVGGGGHARAAFEQAEGNLRFVGIDRDPEAVEA